jgi:hypothetical protein
MARMYGPSPTSDPSAERESPTVTEVKSIVAGFDAADGFLFMSFSPVVRMFLPHAE